MFAIFEKVRGIVNVKKGNETKEAKAKGKGTNADTKIRQFSHFFSETALGISFKSAGRRD